MRKGQRLSETYKKRRRYRKAFHEDPTGELQKIIDKIAKTPYHLIIDENKFKLMVKQVGSKKKVLDYLNECPARIFFSFPIRKEIRKWVKSKNYEYRLTM